MTENPIHNKTNLDIYSSADVIGTYAYADYLTDCERAIFEQDIGKGKRILDLGVGGGRTAVHLAPGSSEYIGSDYSEGMVQACRERFPHLCFEVIDAADLSRFSDASFDVVLFSFNGLGNLYPAEKRLACHNEVFRVLKPQGLWVFSLHNAGSLFFRPPKGLRPTLGAIRRSVPRLFARICTKAYWRGMDYFNSDTHGGMKLLFAKPEKIREEVEGIGFKVERILGDDYPRRNIPLMTRWYYYVCRKG